MPSPSVLALYAVAAVAVLLVPGPAVLYIVSQSVRQGRRAGIASVLGIHAGSLVQVAFAVLGGSYLLVASSLTFSVVKYLGAAYLVDLGVRKLLGRDEQVGIGADGAAASGASPKTGARLFDQGRLGNVLNPKLALVVFAFLPQCVDRSRGTVPAQVATFGIVFVLLGLCTDGTYALVAGSIGPWLRGHARVLRGERYVVGATFIGLGVAAALSGSRRTR
jgi:threonine/homoserine/homoserine lactone efflux protein